MLGYHINGRCQTLFYSVSSHLSDLTVDVTLISPSVELQLACYYWDVQLEILHTKYLFAKYQIQSDHYPAVIPIFYNRVC